MQRLAQLSISGELARNWRFTNFGIVTKRNPRMKEGAGKMDEYVFLYRGGRLGRSPEQAQRVIERWMEWFKGLSENGHLRDRGHPLGLSGKLVSGGGQTISDGPFAEAKDVVGGFTVILAKDIDEAAELSRTCPILETGGQVEVRPVMKRSS